MLAADSVIMVADHASLRGSAVLDVGGGPGYFCDAFADHGAWYVGLDTAAESLLRSGASRGSSVQASGLALPFRTASFDIVFSSNVAEHVADPESLAEEMLRVTRPGGVAVLSFTPWLSPWGGHETAPWHYLGGHRARRRYERRHGGPPKNVYGASLYPLSVARMARWASRSSSCAVDAVFARYHPWWARWVASVPLLGEVASWNVVLVLRRR